MLVRDRLTNYFKSSFPCIALETFEEQRACGDIISAAKAAKKSVTTWSAIEGLVNLTDRGPVKWEDTEDLLSCCKKMLSVFAEKEEARQSDDSVPMMNTVVILRDVAGWPFDRDPFLARAFHDLLQAAPPEGSCIVVVGPTFKTWPSIEKLVTVVPYDLPTVEDLKEVVSGISQSIGKDIPPTDDILRALSGLCVSEAENALALSWIEEKTFSPKIINREKTAAVRRSGLLELIEPDPNGLDSVGGLDNLKAWIVKRTNAFSERAREYGLPPLKGILITGIPGTGKSLSAKAIGTALGIPTVRLDVGALFNSLVGESEARTRAALALAEAIAPCVLWIEELEKSFSGVSSGDGDSGTGKRVFGTVLTWLQERKKQVFLVATANDITALPPEFTRKGRFDELFAVDLPTQSERVAILRVLLKKYGRNPDLFDVPLMANSCNDFTGAEMEACLTESMFSAFDANREVNVVDFAEARSRIVPMAIMAKDRIDAIRNWAKTNARPAALVVKEVATKVKNRSIQ